MSDTVISVENLAKRYTIGSEVRQETLRDALQSKWRHLWRRRRNAAAEKAGQTGSGEEFWALRDVSFEVKRGDVVGIVGRNGAGKSTLLKVLSRITEPTVGRIRLKGRLASLLEVGTGFHPELTGRENIFLNGAILGMTRVEIRDRFDEIVEFAEIGPFLDTPVKRYSSGMYVRLAFAVAAHLNPEILIVDEVLAVGDAQFQKKCLNKMGDVCKQGDRTVLFVSHNAAALLNVCRQGLWLERGRAVAYGPIGETLGAYLRTGTKLEERFSRADDQPHITFVRIDEAAQAEGNLVIHVGFTSPFPLVPSVGIILSTKLGQPVTGYNGRMAGAAWQPAPARTGVVTAHLDRPALHSDTYRASVWLGDTTMDYDERRDAVEFEFVSKNFYPQSPAVEIIGPLDLPWRWSYAPATLPSP